MEITIKMPVFYRTHHHHISNGRSYKTSNIHIQLSYSGVKPPKTNAYKYICHVPLPPRTFRILLFCLFDVKAKEHTKHGLTMRGSSINRPFSVYYNDSSRCTDISNAKGRENTSHVNTCDQCLPAPSWYSHYPLDVEHTFSIL